MNMGSFFGQSPVFSQRTTQRLSQQVKLGQRLEVRQTHADLSIRIGILAALYPSGPAHPEGDCPQCHYSMTIEEILRGFLDDINDTTTECPQCKHRFHPKIVSRSGAVTVSIGFLCERQTLGRLEGLESLSFEQIQQQHPQVLASARFYWGSLAKGFSLLGVSYTKERPRTWKDKMQPFLGKCPDALIAELCNVAPSTVRRYRVSLGIDAFQKSKATSVN